MSDVILDIKARLNLKKSMEGPSFVVCNICGDEETGFAAVGQFNSGGAYFITKLLCLSKKCRMESQVDIEGGFVQGGEI